MIHENLNMALEPRNGLESLKAEIHRIVTAPACRAFMISFGIRVLLFLDIKSWATEKPCQINALGSILLDNLRRWPYTLHIFTPFGKRERVTRLNL